MAIFHSSGKVSVSIQLLKIFVNDGPIIELANFRSLQGTPSNPMAFFSSSSLSSSHSVVTLRALKEKAVLVGCK